MTDNKQQEELEKIYVIKLNDDQMFFVAGCVAAVINGYTDNIEYTKKSVTASIIMFSQMKQEDRVELINMFKGMTEVKNDG